MATSIGSPMAARRRRSRSGLRPIGCGSGMESWRSIRRRCRQAHRPRSHVRQ